MWITAAFSTAFAPNPLQYEVNINFLLRLTGLSKGMYLIVLNLTKINHFMKWVVASSSAKQEIYELWDEDKKLLTLDFHPFTNMARIESADEKRVFLIRKEGFLRNKIVLRNEYGMKMGHLGYEKGLSNEGFVDLDNEHFTYRIDNNPIAELKIFRDSKEEPLVVCKLKPKNGNASVHFNKGGELSASEHMLLMSLCWYMFLPIAKENTLEYAL